MLRILTPSVQPVAPSFVGVLKYDPTQPRAPKGSSQGGEFVKTPAAAGITMEWPDDITDDILDEGTSAEAMKREPLPPTLAAAEDRIRKEYFEHAFLLKDGTPFKVLGDNDTRHVRIGDATPEELKDAVLTHNHPSSYGLSGQDGITASVHNLLEIRAVTQGEGKRLAGTHSARRTGTTWPENFKQAIKDMDAELKLDLGQQIKNKEITDVEANATHHILMYQRLQKKLGGFVYTFEPKT